MRHFLRAGAIALGLAVAGLGGSVAFAATWTLGTGNNECAGQNGFSNCTLNGSPSIIKYNNPAGSLVLGDTNTNFASITGAELTFSNLVFNGTNLIGFNWSYLAGVNDPGVTAVVLAAGGAWKWTTNFTVVGNLFFGSVSTLDAGLVNKQGIAQNISHITLFDSYIPPAIVPVPAAGLLLVGALGGLAALRRRRTVV